jgi:hypothetical protein
MKNIAINIACKPYLVLPRAGMTHPVLQGKPELSAQIATKAVKEFIDTYPDSSLKIIFTVLGPEEEVDFYRQPALGLGNHP